MAGHVGANFNATFISVSPTRGVSRGQNKSASLGKANLGLYSPGVEEVPCGTSSAVGEYLSQGQGYPFPTYLTRGLALYARETQFCKAINMWKEVWPSQLGPNVIGHNAAFLAPHVLGKYIL